MVLSPPGGIPKAFSTLSFQSQPAPARRRLSWGSARPRAFDLSFQDSWFSAGGSTDRHFLEKLDVVECLTAAEHDGADGVVGDHDREPRFLAQQDVEVLEQRTTAREHDALVDDVRSKLGRRALEGKQHRLDDRARRLGKRLADFFRAHDYGLRNARDHVAPLHFHRELLFERVRVADRDLDAFGGLLTDRHVVLSLHVRDDRFVHLVAADPNALRIDDAGERYHGDLGRTAADVDDHVAARLGDRKPGADRRSHGLFDQENLAGTGTLRALLHGALLDFGDAERHADDD